MKNITNLVKLRQDLHENGYQPVAVDGKRPTQQNWTQRVGTDGIDPKAPNTGILTRGLQVIDIDCDDIDIAEKLKDITSKVLGSTPLIRYRENSPRVCLVYRAADGEPKKRVWEFEKHKVEILGNGQQFVAYGLHPSGVPYKWISDAPDRLPLERITAVTNAQIEQLFDRLDYEFDIKRNDANETRRKLSIYPSERREFSDDKTERLIAKILSGESYHDPLRDLAAQFASDGLSEFRISPLLRGFMNSAPKALSPDERKRWTDRYNQIPALAKSAVNKYRPKPDAISMNGKQLFKLEPWNSIKFDPANDNWLVEGLFPPEGLAVIYGQQKNYKSFVASDVALAISRGGDWAGKKVLQGPVVYIAGEGASGFRKRIEGYRAHHELKDADLPFFLIAARPNLGTAGGDVVALKHAIQDTLGEQKPRLIVLDTLSRMLAGQNENGEGMQCFIDNAETLADQFNCLAIAVHHAGKNTESGMRGHSSLPAAAVANWLVKKTGNLKALVTIENSKDEEDGNGLIVDLKKIEFEFHESYKVVPSTLVVEKVEISLISTQPNEQRVKKSPSALKMFMFEFDQALKTKGQQIKLFAEGPQIKSIQKKDLCEAYCRARNDDILIQSKIKAFDRDFKKALDQVLVRSIEIEGIVWIWKM